MVVDKALLLNLCALSTVKGMKYSMKKRVLRIETKIMILVIILMSLSVTIMGMLASSWIDKNLEKKIEDNIENIASLIARDDEIITALSTKDKDGVIQSIVQNYLNAVDNVTFIVVADMDSVRYSHPVPERIGDKFVGGDEKRVVKTGESYISESLGTLGRSLRAFVPVIHRGEQVGFVSVGTLTSSIDAVLSKTFNPLLLWISLTLGIGILGSYLISRSIKKSLLGLEPGEIVKSFTEKASMLDAIHEGIISVNELGEITYVNSSALKILGIDDIDEGSVVGSLVNDIFPTSRLINIIETGRPEYDKEHTVNGRVVLTNRVAIINKGKTLGAIATFRDKTEVMKLAEELTGINQIVEALRANSHEFLNKIHVILGLLQIKEYFEAERYLQGVVTRQKNIITSVVKMIKDPVIVGLLFGKISRASELGINIIIDKRSILLKEHGGIDSSVLIKCIGNLIENAFFALRNNEVEKFITVFIFEDEKEIYIEVDDRGIGIEQKNLNKIFEKGYSTKEGSSGVGLYLVKNIVAENNGKIEVDSEFGLGTIFRITIPKGGKL